MKRLKESPSGLLWLIGGVIAGFTAAAYLCFVIPVIPADAQGVGFFGTSTTGTRTNCTQITAPVIGQTVCFDQAANVWKVYTGASVSASNWTQGAATATGVNNVRDYGATGDGTTDDTTAIQAATDLCRGTLNFPAGIYRTTSQVTNRGGCRWIGLGSGPGGNTTAGNNASLAAIIEHDFNGDALQITGLSGDVLAGVGPGVENMIFRQVNGAGAGASGSAIRVTKTTDTFAPSWIRIRNVTMEVASGKNDWTHGIVLESFGAAAPNAGGGLRDTWIENVRIQSGANATDSINASAVANLFIANSETNGTNGHVTITAPDAGHQSAGVHLNHLQINGTLSLDFVTTMKATGGLWTSLTTTANCNNASLVPMQITNTPTWNCVNSLLFVGTVGPTGTAGLWGGGASGIDVRTNQLSFRAATTGNFGTIDNNILSFFTNGNARLQIGTDGGLIGVSASGAQANGASQGSGTVNLASHVFINGVPMLRGDRTPACVNNCGTNPSVSGNNSAMRVTMGATGTPRSPFLVNFVAPAWTNAPACIAQLTTATTTTVSVTNSTTTGVTVNTLVGPAQGDVYAIHCLGVG